jgi:hypothetical protein
MGASGGPVQSQQLARARSEVSRRNKLSPWPSNADIGRRLWVTEGTVENTPAEPRRRARRRDRAAFGIRPADGSASAALLLLAGRPGFLLAGWWPGARRDATRPLARHRRCHGGPPASPQRRDTAGPGRAG